MMHQTTAGRTCAGIVAFCALCVAAFAITVICLDRYQLYQEAGGTCYTYNSYSYGYSYYNCRGTCAFSSDRYVLSPCFYLFAVGAVALVLQLFICTAAWIDRKFAYVSVCVVGSVNAAWWLAAGIYFTLQIMEIQRLLRRNLVNGDTRITVQALIWAAFAVSLMQLGAIIASMVLGRGRSGADPSKLPVGSYQDGQHMAMPAPAYAGPPYAAPQAAAGYAPQYAQPPAGYAPQYAQPPAGYAPQYAQPPTGYAPQYAQPPAGYAPQYAQPQPGYAPQYAQPPANYASHGTQAPAHNAPEGAQTTANDAPQGAQVPANNAPKGAEAPANNAPQGAQPLANNEPEGAKAWT